MNIAVLICIMIPIVIGIGLISPVNQGINKIQTVNDISSGAIDIFGNILPMIFVAILILSGVAWFAFSNSEENNSKERTYYKINSPTTVTDEEIERIKKEQNETAGNNAKELIKENKENIEKEKQEIKGKDSYGRHGSQNIEGGS